MELQRDENEWIGLKGRIGGWLLGGPMRRLLELAFMNVKPRLLKRLAIKGDELIVDVGSGSGFYSIPVAEELDVGQLMHRLSESLPTGSSESTVGRFLEEAELEHGYDQEERTF